MNLRHWQAGTSIGGTNLIVATIWLMLSAKLGDSQEFDELEERKYRPAEKLDDSVVSGIRGLEYVRRLVIDDSRIENSTDRRSSSIGDGRSVGGDAVAGEKHQSRRQANSAMYEALSRLANVRVARPPDDASGRETLKDGNLQDGKFREAAHVEKNLAFEGSRKDGNATRNESSSSVERPKVFDSSRLSRRKFQCSPINEIYIPNAEKKMPAYLCALGGRAFVVSSERFNQESRERFSVSLDDDTYMRLNPIRSGTTALTSAVSVLPATLVLNRGDHDYTVRGVSAD